MWNGSKLEECKPGVSPFFHMSFSFVSDPENAGRDWYNFGCIENMPSCLKFKYPHNEIEFRIPPGSQNKSLLMIDIWAVIQTIPYEDRFHLNVARWDRVKSDLSDGWCYSPWVTVDSKSGTPELMDGRHRMVALLKFTEHRKIPFIVDTENQSLVENFFNQKLKENTRG